MCVRFKLKAIYFLNETANEDLPKHTIVGVDKDNNWYRYVGHIGGNKYEEYLRDPKCWSSSLHLFRNYWYYIEAVQNSPYLNQLVNAKKTLIKENKKNG